MTESSTKKTTVLDAFLKQREKRQNDTGIQAQKLVNLYRHLALFGDDFLGVYNKMLLDASPDVQMALNDVMGGMIVRQYLEFLRSKQQKPDTELDADEKPFYATESSYLPSPDDITPFQAIPQIVTGSGTPAEVKSSVQSELAVKNQSVFLEQALAKQTEFLGAAMTHMQDNLAKQLNGVQSKVPVATTASPDMTKILEQILEKQNQVLMDSLKQVFENSAEITAKQMETFEQVLRTNLSQEGGAYPEIEEYTPETVTNYVPETYVMTDKAKNTPVPPRAYHPQTDETEIVPDEEMKIEPSGPLRTPIPPKVSPKMVLPDEDVEILSEIDLPSEPL